jgi:hypothetical protein
LGKALRDIVEQCPERYAKDLEWHVWRAMELLKQTHSQDGELDQTKPTSSMITRLLHFGFDETTPQLQRKHLFGEPPFLDIKRIAFSI